MNEREHSFDSQTSRVVYFDWLRILATFSVIIIHCPSTLSESSLIWFANNVYYTLFQWAVPMFVMISGALFLGREQTLQKLFKKNILRIATAFVFWSVFYACWRYFVTHEKHSIREMLLSMIKGHYHMWFLFMLVGLYLIVPFLNRIVGDSKLAVYFVTLSFLFSFIIPQVINIMGLRYAGASNTIRDLISMVNLELVLGYSGYFVLGYLLSRIRINKVQEFLIYVLGLCGAVVAFFSTYWIDDWQVSFDVFKDRFTVNVLVLAIAIFVFAKQHLNKPFKNEKAVRVLSYLSKCTFGVYLVHPLVIDCLIRFARISELSFNPIVSIPVIALLAFCASMAISMILNRIPLVKKWFV